MASAADTAYDELRSLITTGGLAPGERLREENLAERLDVSRTPIREALRRLESDGFVSMEPNRGARVTEWSDEDLEDIFELRALLEGHAAAQAARRSTGDDVDLLEGLAYAMRDLLDAKKPNVDRMSALNNEFHQAVVEAAHSPRLGTLLASVVQLPLVMRTFARYSRVALERSVRHHLELVDAIRARDEEWARAVMHAHVRAGLARARG